MITIMNDTVKPFKVLTEKVTDTKKMKNRRLTVAYGKMNFDAFFDENDAQAVAATIVGTSAKTSKFLNTHTRLYQSNKEHLPILVASKINSNNANFLFAAQKLTETERVVRVIYDGAFALARDFVKGRHLALVASFRVDRPTSLTVITVDGETVYETKYSCETSEKKVTKELTTHETSKYTKFDTSKRGIIKPYRLLKPTHLVFTEKQYLDQAENICNKNSTVITVSNSRELADNIKKYKDFGFTAASLFIGMTKNDKMSGVNAAYLKTIKENFTRVHLVHEDAYTIDLSVKPEIRRPQRPYTPGKKVTNNRADKTLVSTK